jgi:hypothetical protein
VRLWRYCLSMGKVFFSSFKSGIMYTALIDLGIFLYRSRNIVLTAKPHIQ